MEDELNRMLGLKTGKGDSKEQKQRPPIRDCSTQSSTSGQGEPTLQKRSPPSAFSKLFPATLTQYPKENHEVVQQLLSTATQVDTNAKVSKMGFMRSDSYPVPQSVNQYPRGSYQRKTQNRQFVANPLFQQGRPQPANHDFFGSSRAINTSPKLTDLKPSSVK
ncbi:unnamed protein product [Strongylus vulgaris]|uniref:Uncharacterized protein n=1 Tax=Strongylus vulgaris TaxID=40348 RepID=A0A3P7LXL5_STRVU|nr:unnamed protein product [Strongylus vulgaris]